MKIKDSLCRFKCNIEARSCNHCCHGKAIIITYPSVCVCASSLSYPQCNAYVPHCTVICGLPGSITVFFILSHKRYDLWEKVTENKMCVLISSTIFVWIISHSKKNRPPRHDQKSTLVLIQSNRYSCRFLIKV
jgi:hypothetical protein